MCFVWTSMCDTWTIETTRTNTHSHTMLSFQLYKYTYAESCVLASVWKQPLAATQASDGRALFLAALTSTSIHRVSNWSLCKPICLFGMLCMCGPRTQKEDTIVVHNAILPFIEFEMKSIHYTQCSWANAVHWGGEEKPLLRFEIGWSGIICCKTALLLTKLLLFGSNSKAFPLGGTVTIVVVFFLVHHTLLTTQPCTWSMRHWRSCVFFQMKKAFGTTQSNRLALPAQLNIVQSSTRWQLKRLDSSVLGLLCSFYVFVSVMYVGAHIMMLNSFLMRT